MIFIHHSMVTQSKYKLLCPRGDTNLRAGRGQHRPCRKKDARCRKTPYPARLTEMEKWSWIRIRNPISTKIELVLQVHPLLPPTKFGGDPWTCSWDILRTNTVRTDRHTPMTTRPCGLRRAGNNLRFYNFVADVDLYLFICLLVMIVFVRRLHNCFIGYCKL